MQAKRCRSQEAKKPRSQEARMKTGRLAARTFTDFIVWQNAHDCVLDAYKFSGTFPRTETYGRSAQFRRAAISVPANIDEGFRKRGPLDKARFMNISQGSLEECRYS